MFKKFLSFGQNQNKPQPKIVADINLTGFDQLIDLLPEAAFPDSNAKNVLEKLNEMRTLQKGVAYHQEDEIAINLSVVETDDGPMVTVWEYWKGPDGKRAEDSTTTFSNFKIGRDKEKELLDKIAGLNGSSAESKG